jgi:WD40-like Beta Propeller Repeat
MTMMGYRARHPLPGPCAFVIGSLVSTGCTPLKGDVTVGAPSFDSGDAQSDAEVNETRPSDSRGSTPSGGLSNGTLGCALGKPFGAPRLVAGLETAATWLGGLRFSPDLQTAYFFAFRASSVGGSSDLYSATRATPGSTLERVSPVAGIGINTADDEDNPTVSGEGLMLIFGRSQGLGNDTHLYYATRGSPSDPFNDMGLVPNVNVLNTVDKFPFLRQDGEALYFSSTRNFSANADVYRAAWNGSTFDTPVGVAELNTPYDDDAPVVAPDDLAIYFTSERPDPSAAGGQDIWMATRASTNEPFSRPTNVTELNSPDSDIPTFITADGCTLYFSSTRGRTSQAAWVATKPPK